MKLRQFLNNEKFNKLKDFIIKYYIPIILIGAPIGGVLGLGGMILYNQSTSFCLKCHYVKGNYIAIDLRSNAHQGLNDGGPGCIGCHPDKAIEMILIKSMRKSKHFAQRVANLRVSEVVKPEDAYTTEECLQCHPDRLTVMERDIYLLPSEGLQVLGLILNKMLHHRFETFSEEDEELYNELKSKTNLSEADSLELAILEKIRVGNCGQCHMQKKMFEEKRVRDKQVNFVARNPISCAGCHEEATTLMHPGHVMRFPVKEVCQKCHHGKIHGKFTIFKADCEEQYDTDHCVKCHPYFEPEMFN